MEDSMKKNIALCIVFLLLAVSAIWGESYQDAVNKRLITAARDQDINGLREAVYDDANLNYTETNSDKTALMIACEKEWREGVKFLLEKGANLSFKNNAEQNALMFAVKHCENDMLLKDLISYGANVNDRDEAGKTVLMYAVDNDNDNALIYLLKKTNANPKAVDNSNCNAMMYAAKNGKVVAFKILADLRNVNWDQADRDGNNAFMLAVSSGNIAIVRSILSGYNGFDLYKKNGNGQPVLFWAIEKRKSEEMIGVIMRAYDPAILITAKDEKKRDIRWYIETYKNSYAQKVLDEILD